MESFFAMDYRCLTCVRESLKDSSFSFNGFPRNNRPANVIYHPPNDDGISLRLPQQQNGRTIKIC